ncbi:TetR/AcrR family transcriptional regulator [Streptomyces boncukensis]|uniref:TetR/AcrR family transcriptional regulator n=1 Tax=Streptomyces boncukensis TaxID=2711219 RepID=A0A6G4X4C3_9ACTN|nr:TetR/AcrR family transcriptional regulator [Streptomyces boncukensis]NGO72103.1 TetR/AcrR family transcriptional regulator [Streptomyces boncukensis]
MGSAARSASAPAAMPRARADAARNRERILAAAREAFVRVGTEAPLDEIAKAAGVGNATLYRHFPDRDALAQGVVLAVADGIAERGRLLLAEESDPFEALRRFVCIAVEEKSSALCPLMSHRINLDDPVIRSARDRTEKVAIELLERAQRAGAVRDDIGAGDVLVAVSQLARPLPGTVTAGMARFIERHVTLFLDGLRAPAKSPLPGRPATLEDLRAQHC